VKRYGKKQKKGKLEREKMGKIWKKDKMKSEKI
jgi:hypothetical protein